jgi:hypothetical protein
MTTCRLRAVFAITGLVIGAPFTIVHLIAKPNDAPITPLQHVTAALANFFGPWGVAIVRIVDFPNAGLRSFSWGLALGLTVMGVLLVALASRMTKPLFQLTLAVLWGLFSITWFGVGLMQIASGLL